MGAKLRKIREREREREGRRTDRQPAEMEGQQLREYHHIY